MDGLCYEKKSAKMQIFFINFQTTSKMNQQARGVLKRSYRFQFQTHRNKPFLSRTDQSPFLHFESQEEVPSFHYYCSSESQPLLLIQQEVGKCSLHFQFTQERTETSNLSMETEINLRKISPKRKKKIETKKREREMGASHLIQTLKGLYIHFFF